ncbi:ABC transporter permease [Acinetobacter qingfengensis]|uniref:Multidrug ABC transporter permease n=1 Tax=Acinetobacter qingfengensis TaxID=1262585 RepID=A0A1E7R1J1_9GAMM|nr:ABC transporter permease [Acinetobacter qingfengensis]KAA8733315.1 ABC transporter permease [Acinetobacter qingfengensis]OEY93164.1 multidrug ABC transporter permease [Acinetobacter qingfengensis]
MWHSLRQELRQLIANKWDLAMVTLAPLFVILLFTSMFSAGKAEHLPIAVIDQDHSDLSRSIENRINLNHSLSVYRISENQQEIEQLLNATKIWGYIHIPAGAENRLVNAQDAQISIAYNQSFFSIGNTISSAMMTSAIGGMAEFGGENYLEQTIPYLNIPTPHIKISVLYNPDMSYEFYLEPFVVMAVLHLLLCCCVAFSTGQLLTATAKSSVWVTIFSKSLLYCGIFLFWTWLWMFWLVEIRGWFIAGQLSLILLGQFLLYLAYALLAILLVMATKNLSKTFGIIAVYGGSSLSFAGVTLPLNNAPLFTKFWANIIPYTAYAKLQTEQWVVGSPLWVSLQPLALLVIYVLLYAALAAFFLKKYWKTNLKEGQS